MFLFEDKKKKKYVMTKKIDKLNQQFEELAAVAGSFCFFFSFKCY